MPQPFAPVTLDDRYTGEVSVDTKPQRRVLSTATITKMAVGPMDNNSYVITCKRTRDSLLIDAANDSPRLVSLVTKYAPRLTLIVTTHRHPDHWQALQAIVHATGAPTAAHDLDADALPVLPNRRLANGDQLGIGDLRLDVIHLNGHTPGGIALALTDKDTTHVFTGDSLFPGGLGKTQDPDGFASLYNDVKSRIFDRFDDKTVIYPGHGKDTTLGAERPHLGEWFQRGW